jgi:hypothetical protein
MNPPAPGFRKVRIGPVDCLAKACEVMNGQYLLFVCVCLVGLLIAGFAPMAILLGPMMCGIFLCYLKKMRGETVTFNQLFKGFDTFVESLIATLILMGLSLVTIVPLCLVFVAALVGQARAIEQGSAATIAVGISVALLCLGVVLVVTALAVFFYFTYLLIVDRRLGGFEAVKLSARAVQANLGGVVGLVILSFLANLAGLMCCYVGVFFVSPITLGAQAVAYRKVFPQTDASSPASKNRLQAT